MQKEGGFLIEVLFGESEAGSMKIAKNKYNFEDEDKVICLGFMMDIGDIKENADSPYRRNLIHSFFAQDQWGGEEEVNRECRNAGDVYCSEMNRLLQYLEQGEAVRAWYSNAPYSICGFYHLCSLLQHYENEIWVVKLPEYELRKDGTVILYNHWGEVFPEVFEQYLPYEKKLCETELNMYIWEWAKLQEDNSPLRAVVNGRLLGVPEDFYDFLIWKRITKKPETEARLIGDILGDNQIGMGDWWYARRIDQLIDQRKIRIVEDSEKKYARLICQV